MKTYITKTWKFYTTGVQGKCKCKVCGKTITKKFSSEYREDSIPDLTSCKEAKEAWEKEEHICLSCMKKSLVTGGEDITNNYDSKFKELEEIRQQVRSLESKALEISRTIHDDLKDKIIIHYGTEYVIEGVSEDIRNGYAYAINCTSISKKEPWKTSGGYRSTYFTDSYGRKQFRYNNYVDRNTDSYKIIDEKFSERKTKLDKWLKEME